MTGLVAGTTGYSRSPAMHNRMAAELETDFVYVPFATDDVGALLAGLRDAGVELRGVSVTNPFKTTVLREVDRVDPIAARAGAANTLVVEPDGTVTALNTDIEGSMRPLEAKTGGLTGLRVGVVGAGGAARAVACGLAQRGATTTIFARRLDLASEVAGDCGARARPLADVGLAGLDVLVNCTPVGTAGVDEGRSPVPSSALAGIRLVYDLVYAPERTRLLEDAEQAGCATLGGLPMLATQAALQFELWTGARVDPARMLAFAAV